MKEEITIIGCSIFQEELEHILSETRANLKIKWMEVGLHDNIERLEETLDQQVKKNLESNGNLAFLYGWGCLPEMEKFAAARNVKYLPAKNCLSALIGEQELKKLEQNRTLIASPGWVRKMWLGRAGTASGWTADDFRMQFGRYDLILILDTGLNPLTDEEIINCFDLIQVPLEVKACDLKHFKKTFAAMLEAVS